LSHFLDFELVMNVNVNGMFIVFISYSDLVLSNIAPTRSQTNSQRHISSDIKCCAEVIPLVGN